MNIMPLEFWRLELSYNPWHFWGCYDPTLYPVTSKCNDVIMEYGWMDTDQSGRQDIITAIESAENLLIDHLHYAPAPRFNEVTLPWPDYVDKRLYRTARRDALGGWIPITLKEGHVQNCGIEQLTLIQAAAPVVWSDSDGDLITEVFTVSAPTTVTNIKDIAVYISAADRPMEDNALSEKWRIQPVMVSISGGVVTVHGYRWLCVLPSVYRDRANYPILSTDDANFVSTLDIYERIVYTDGENAVTNSQAALIWESKPCCWGCGTTVPSSTDPASEGWVAARSGIRNSVDGIVIPAEAVYDRTTGLWSHPCQCYNTCGEPDKVLIRYYAGYPTDIYGNMARPMRTLVARLACAEMQRRICACDIANREWTHWATDVTRINGPEVYQANLEIFNNPLGTKRGHLFAWQQIRNLARTVGVLA